MWFFENKFENKIVEEKKEEVVTVAPVEINTIEDSIEKDFNDVLE